MIVLSLPVTCSMAGIATNIITCASGVPRDLGGVSFQLVMREMVIAHC